MDKLQEQFFEALTVNRAEGAKALEGFALRGVKNSVVEKYTDQAHFIYELLQNADDAKASSVRFVLFKDKLVFVHNGTRRFTVSDPATEAQDLESGNLGDINAISAVGGSNKTDEATIGKFGVGFKAVFQYTATPHIYDPDVFFKIERFIVPIRVYEDYPGRQNGETMFVFPFDHDKHSPEEAYADISEKLRSLDYPLLFLLSLKEIKFEVSGILGNYGKNVEERRDFDKTTAEFIRLTKNNGEEPYDNTLCMFTRNYGSGHNYSVGYFVDREGRLIPKTHSAFCFFPTKEATGLHFIIHAPFLLNDSREGIRAGVQHNIDMVALLSKLAADSLAYLRDIGLSKKAALIDDNIFDIVPYDESGFTEVGNKESISFRPFYTEIRNAFETEAILPCTDGYAGSGNAYWAFVPRIAELFSNGQLAALTRNKLAKWVFITFGREVTLSKNKVLTNYIDGITAAWLDENDIFKGWSTNDGEKYDGVTADFIEAQPIEWLHSFYKWIAETKGRMDLIPTKPIFLNQDGKATAAFDDNKRPNLFLPVEGGSDYPTVNEALLSNEETLDFIKKLGVGEPSLRDEINKKILPKYKDDGANIDTGTDFKKFFRYYQECRQADSKVFLESLRSCDFVLYRSKSDETQYRGRAQELYFPFEPLIQWFESKANTKFVSFDDYLDMVGADKKEKLVEFLTALGVEDTPRIISSELIREQANKIKTNWPRSTWNQKWTEKCFDGCKELIETIVSEQNTAKSVFLWDQLVCFRKNGRFSISSRDSVLYGIYEYFYYSHQSETFESSEAKCLRTLPWLMNVDGEFVPAHELTRQSINPAYVNSGVEAAELFHLLGIEDKAKEIGDDNVDISSYGESLGLSEEEQRQALAEFAKRKKETEIQDDDIELPPADVGDDTPDISPSSVKRVVKDIARRAVAVPKERPQSSPDDIDDTAADEDDYSKPTVDIKKKIEKVKEQAEREIQKIARLEDLKQQAADANKYSFAWFNALLELESLSSGENNANSREISISFAKVEREEGTSRTLILKHPSRYIPQSMEDLADIPLELHFANQPMVKVAVEVVNVKSYTLRAKLRTNAQIDGVELSLVTEARIEARNPVFLIEELRKAFFRLGDDEGFSDDFDMQHGLCDNIEFIFGPPGTGKTTHLASHVLLPLMKKPQDLKVLALTPTNKSADVLVRRLMECMGNDHSYQDWLVRFGATNDQNIEQSGIFRDKTFDIRSFPRNVTVTTIARFPYDYFLPEDGTRLHLNALKWDYIVIDEASMIPLANIVYPLYKKTPEKFVIAGDPFQIEPITAIDEWKNENIYTITELNSFTEPTTVPHDYHVELLTTQYRSIPEIGEVFSQFAYGGILNHARTSDSQRPLVIGDFMDLKPLNIIKFPVSKFESIYLPKKLLNKTSYQVYSALFAFEYVKYLASSMKIATDGEIFRIGLIAPYRAQADLIDKLMTSDVLPKNVDVQVGTIHGFQGDECDIIIALFNPPPSISTHKDMFLNKLNIVNVSISRARDYLFVLMPDDETENVDNLRLIKKVERLCKQQPIWSERLSPDVEEVMFGSRTYLEDNSFSTSHQLVNIYGKPEKRYEVRSEDNAVDVQIHD